MSTTPEENCLRSAGQIPSRFGMSRKWANIKALNVNGADTRADFEYFQKY
jgi:hypothetical protein